MRSPHRKTISLLMLIIFFVMSFGAYGFNSKWVAHELDHDRHAPQLDADGNTDPEPLSDANSKMWLASLDRLLALKPKPKHLVPGHGAASSNPAADLKLTRDYLHYLRTAMGQAVKNMTPFDEAYAATSWKKYERLPAFRQANRRNAYNTYLLMEREELGKQGSAGALKPANFVIDRISPQQL